MTSDKNNLVVHGHVIDNSSSEEVSSSIIKEETKKTWTSYIWDSLDKSPQERRFLFKLDLAVLTFASLGYFIKNLDQQNINNAFVSGMKEDLGLYGNQLNYMVATWTAGYVIGEIPSNIILTRVRPSIWIPTIEVVWTILTMCMSRCNNVSQIYALRFLIGLAESGFYPGMQYIIGSWYRKDELAKRSCIFHATGALGSMFSGYLMASVYHLGGRGGLKGWQWLFIIDGVISLPIAIAGYFILPDVPEIAKAWYFSKEELDYGKKRMELEGTSAVQIVTTLAYAWTSDAVLNGKRWPPIIFGGAVNILCYVSLAIWDIPIGWKWACYYLMGSGYGLSGLCMAWAHEICNKDNEERAIIIATMNEMAYVLQAWLPLIAWQQVDAPQYRKGFITISVLSFILILTAFAIRVLWKREKLREARHKTAESLTSNKNNERLFEDVESNMGVGKALDLDIREGSIPGPQSKEHSSRIDE
ncbi:hypothetical protein BPOR_0146g00170 [Botrytis porri]|uniref:Major facilitator superfamily (MFS) profile domain-containing protein n=1 Tax=Botrytis porri TaxID=87229 RepID=A0A4Z1KVY7_9HELO|nr:hypothetical protein BPOR_0146g00170 [Botrytis porri]